MRFLKGLALAIGAGLWVVALAAGAVLFGGGSSEAVDTATAKRVASQAELPAPRSFEPEESFQLEPPATGSEWVDSRDELNPTESREVEEDADSRDEEFSRNSKVHKWRDEGGGDYGGHDTSR